MISAALLSLALISTTGQPAAQAPGLQIRVLAGEDAINVIQQKTAVAPLIEVRDRNDVPVAGVAVTFSIQGGGAATFPGAVSTLTAVTNAAGQATVAAVNPVAAGSFSIQVQAAFQGQTALATIAQSNVLTLAEAAAAGSAASTAGAGAGAAGGGGGISATTLAVVGAAVGGGALVATQVGGGDAPAATAAAPTPVTRNLTGPINGTLVHNISFPNGGTPCTIDYTFRADANISITVNADAVSGTFRWTGTDSPTSFTCNVTQPVTNTFSGDFPISGTPAAVTFRNVNSFTQPSGFAGANQNVEIVYAFTGAFDGTVLTGSFTFERTVLTRGSFAQDSLSRTTITVTFR